MLKNLVVYLLEKYLGDYVENFDKEKLKIDLRKGNVVLKNLYLKSNALDDLNLPVTISIGCLQKLTLDVPWKNVYTQPTKVTIDGIYLLVVPKIEFEYNAQKQQETKMKEVRQVEKLRKEKETQSIIDRKNKNNTFIERMELRIIQNLELSIQNIHIVYEDNINHPFSFGITINSISLHTTTSDWKATILEENMQLIHKLGELNALSIYWNTNIKSRSNLSRDEILVNLREKIAINNEETPSEMSYILRPLNIKAKLILSMKPHQENFKRPMFDIKIDLDEINLNINRNQYFDLLDLLEYQNYVKTKSKYIKYQITKEKSSWKFAYEAIVNEEIRPKFECYKWENIKAHLDRCREYRTLHFQELTKKLTNEQKQRIEELEQKLDVFNLIYIRRSVEIEVKKKQKSKWWNKSKSTDDPDNDEKKNLYDDQGEDISTSNYPEEYVDIDLAIRLNMLHANIYSKINPSDTEFRVIARLVMPDTNFILKRRPATDAIAVFVDLGSFEVFGIATDCKQSELSNESRPVLIQPPSSNQKKLLQVEFETNPIDYRLKIVTQSLEIKYNAPTINQLVECFQPNTQGNLQGVKQVAYSTYTDVKHRSYNLLMHNIEKVKRLDIYIDIQSSYFLLPENGVYQHGGATICMDLGHLTLKRCTNDDEESFKPKDIEGARELSYTKFQLKLEDVQLIYANQNESWENARKEKTTRLHLIKPIELQMDVEKCIYDDDAILPAWKLIGNIPDVELRLSDKRLFDLINHIQSIPFPESKHSADEIPPLEAEATIAQSLLSNSEKTYAIIEEMTPVKKALEEVESEKNPDEQTVKKKNNFKGQVTQLEATFRLDKIDLHIDAALNNWNDEPFLYLTLQSIITKTKVKTFDIEFDASLADLIVYHEQFIDKDNQHLRLLSAQLNRENSTDQKLVNVKFLHTSSIYQVHIHLTKFIMNLQLEALLSIFKFVDSLVKKLPKNILPEENNIFGRSVSNQIQADLEEFRVIVASKLTQLFDVQVQGVKVDISDTPEKTLINLILSDLRVFDPYEGARYRKIISQQGNDKELLRIDITLFTYPDGYKKPLDAVDCDVKMQFAKANIIFLFKHIDIILSFIDSLDITMTARDITSVQADVVYEQIQKISEQPFKVHLDFTFNAPNIIIPTNSYSDEAILFDLGKLTLKTQFYNDPTCLLVEQQDVRLENILASRIKLNRDDQIILLECAQLNALINRLLFPRKVQTEPEISIKIEWESVHFQLAKDDYSCIMKVFMENFTENIRDQTPEMNQFEQYHYRQGKEEEALRNAIIQTQKDILGDQILQIVKVQAEVKKLLLTLYLGESDTPRNENLKLANVQMEMLEVSYCQQSDSTYKVMTTIKNCFLDDLRKTNRPTSVTRLMDRHFTVDPDIHMFVASFGLKPKTPSNSMAFQQCKIELESLYICMSLEFLMILLDFFVSGLPMSDENNQTRSHMPTMVTDLPSISQVKTRYDIIVKNSEIILLEDQHNNNSNCLVLDLALQMRIITIGDEMKLNGSLTDLTVYSSNFAQLKDSKNAGSKVKYRILQPAKADVIIIMDKHQQKIDVRISDIIVSIAPEPVRILIGVTSSLGTLQTSVVQDKVNSKSLFDPKPFKHDDFWFTKGFFIDENIDSDDIQVKQKVTKKEGNIETHQTLSIQQLILTVKTVEIKLEVGLGSVTKSVVAMCLSNLTGDVKNWSMDLSLSSTVHVEAALFNERMFTWEPLIEPTIDERGTNLSPWCITCSILPRSRNSENLALPFVAQKQKKDVSSSMILFHADQLLNLTITKTGLDLVQRLSTLFNDVYNKRLPSTDDDDQPMLSLLNSTGCQLFINNLQGLQFAEDISLTSTQLKENENISLTIPNDRRQSGVRLSVIEEQDFKRRQEFSIKIGDVVKTVSINRIWQRVYDLRSSSNLNCPMQMLCDAQIRNGHRLIILRSIVKVFNNTAMPLVILSIDSDDVKNHRRIARVEVNDEYCMPIDLLYQHSSSLIFIAIDEDEPNGVVNDLFSFDWKNEFSTEKNLKLKNGTKAHFIVFKELNQAYLENTDQLDRTSFNLYVQPVLYLTNLLPIDIQCFVDNTDYIDLKPSQLNLITCGNKHSVLIFIIPSYENTKWIAEPVDLTGEGIGDHNEHLVVFHSSRRILRMILRVDTFHESYRLLLYSPFWILNRTELKLEFQIENNKTSIEVVQTPFLVCPEKYENEASKKGQIRLYGIDDTTWSEEFPLDMIKSIGIASCKVSNDRVYMVCVDIVTSSFGLTKIVTLSPFVVIINKSTIEIEVVADKEDNTWISMNPEQIIPFWPHNIRDDLMRVRYRHNRVTSSQFMINQKHRTLLRMDDEERPAIYVEVTATDFEGVRVIFGDYKIGDAPLLVVNCLKNDPISLCQVGDMRTIVLLPQNYVYYTWLDPLKPRELIVACGSKRTELELTPQCGFLGEDGVTYTIFIDDVQNVLLFADDTKIIETVSEMTSLSESIGQCVQIGIHDIGLSIVNDITREEILYINLSKSKVIWTETQRSHVRPLSNDVNTYLEELYKNHIEQRPNDKKLIGKKYHMEVFQEISFHGDTAELVSSTGQKRVAKRQALDGLWIEYAWSDTNVALYIRINRMQIDNQLDYTMFPVVLYPIISKTTGTDLGEKPFIELSVYQSKTSRSNVMHFKYFKLLIQEFAVKIDQRLIVSILAFLREENSSSTPIIDMNTDFEQIEKALDMIVKAQIDTPTGDREMYFDNIHLSPLKIHFSFSIHGSKPSEELLMGYPLIRFLLKTLNVAEVQDAILRLGYYERTYDRYTITKLTDEVSLHYQNQFVKQIHVLVFGLDVLGNPFGLIRGLAKGVESFFYEPYKGAIEGPIEFAEGMRTGIGTLFGSAVGGAAGAVSKITGVLGKGLASLTFDEKYKMSRIKRRESATGATKDIAVGGKNVVMGFVDGVKGVVTNPVSGAKQGGAKGFVKGLGKGFLGLVARPTGEVADLASTSLDIIKRTAQSEEVVHRVRYPRRIGLDGLVRPYIYHEAMGFYILNRLDNGNYAKSDTYIAHITCSKNPPSWLMATSKRLLFVTEISFLGLYETDWHIEYEDLREEPFVRPNLSQIQILTKEPRKVHLYGKLVKYQNIDEARYIVDKIINAMHALGL